MSNIQQNLHELANKVSHLQVISDSLSDKKDLCKSVNKSTKLNFSARKVVILDLDNTLICSTNNEISDNKSIGTILVDGEQNYIYKRPGLDSFLEKCFKHFDVAIWTASGEDYAMYIIKLIFGDLMKQLKFIYTSKNTVIKYQNYMIDNTRIEIKPLCKIWRRGKFRGKYTKQNTLIIDDTPITYCRNFGNAIKITSWYGIDIHDKEFERIWNILEECLLMDDVRLKKKHRNIDKID